MKNIKNLTLLLAIAILPLSQCGNSFDILVFEDLEADMCQVTVLQEAAQANEIQAIRNQGEEPTTLQLATQESLHKNTLLFCSLAANHDLSEK